MADPLAVTTKATKPIAGQKPGTSGLRKKTRTFMEENYLANFVQATFDALRDSGAKVDGGTLVISGDGRYYNKEAIQIIIKIAVANGVGRVWCGTGGLLSTPAVSAVIRSRDGGFKAFGGFILTASHNPGGIDEDFGIKYNVENGGPAPEGVTDAIFKHTESISRILSADAFPSIDLDKVGATEVKGTASDRSVTVEVFDCTEDYLSKMKECFDLPAIKAFLQRPGVRVVFDGLNGAAGPYAKKLLVDELGAAPDCLLNCTPLEDFGGPSSASHGHADPNLKNAAELCAIMGVDLKGDATPAAEGAPLLGAAADGDADRNMILGPGFFVTPSDSLAVLVNNSASIPFFKQGIKGAARSMPTSSALDLVCKAKGIPFFETPTGWKFFGNLMDAPQYTPFICGEESFGTGSDHVREKDGLWAVLAWLSVLAARNTDVSKPLVGVGEIVRSHWEEYGRNYYGRYDYEGVEKEKADAMMAAMAEKMRKWDEKDAWRFKPYALKTADVFEYTDPIDGSVSKNQGIRFIMDDGSRVIFRLSGTGVSGATIRLYLEKYQAPGGDLALNALEAVKPLAEVALCVSQLKEITGRDAPTLMT